MTDTPHEGTGFVPAVDLTPAADPRADWERRIYRRLTETTQADPASELPAPAGPFAGGMFEALMVNQIVPETSWGPHSFGLADHRIVRVQRRYAVDELGYPVWGMSPSSTADDSGGYGGFGVAGKAFPYHGAGATAADPNLRLAQCSDCADETVVTPHASFLALDPAPRTAYRNIMKIKQMFPGVYGSRGFYDALNPTTGAVGHRILVLDQSMIMASIDNVLRDRAIQRHFAADPVSTMARAYLGVEHMAL